MERLRRSPRTPKATTGMFRVTEGDVRHILEPLSRYGRLPTSHLLGLHPHPNYLPIRLKRLFHEAEALPHSQKILQRPRVIIGQQTYHELAPGALAYLKHYGYYTDLSEHWINFARLGPQNIPSHDDLLRHVVCSIEIAAGDTFISHRLILREAPEETQIHRHPLHIPLSKGYLDPDALFGIEYGDRAIFYAVEIDLSNEPMTSKDAMRQSIERKIKSYNEARYKKHLGIPNLLILWVVPSKARAEAIKKLATEHKAGNQHLFKVIPAPAPYQNPPPPMPEIFGVWDRATTPFDIRTGKETTDGR